MRLRKKAIPKGMWAVVDRYDGMRDLEDTYPSKAAALRSARNDVAKGYSVNGSLSVVRIAFLAATEIIVDAPRQGKAER